MKEITNEDGETENVVDQKFTEIATTVALAAPNADDTEVCADSRNDSGECPGATKDAWIFKLRKGSENFFRKASASPTIFGGLVYYQSMNRQKEVLNALSEVLLFVLLMMNVELTDPKLYGLPTKNSSRRK